MDGGGGLKLSGGGAGIVIVDPRVVVVPLVVLEKCRRHVQYDTLAWIWIDDDDNGSNNINSLTFCFPS